VIYQKPKLSYILLYITHIGIQFDWFTL